MGMERLIPSPACQLPKKAMAALEQATIDEILEPGAFAEMAHLPLAGVLFDALQYANTLLEGLKEGSSSALRPGDSDHSLLDLPLMPEDAAFLSQVMALHDLATANAIQPSNEENESGPTLGEVVDAARGHLMDRYHHWFTEPGRRGENVVITKGDRGHIYPCSIAAGTASHMLPGSKPNMFAMFVALPLVAPFLMGEEDCFVAPRLE